MVGARFIELVGRSASVEVEVDGHKIATMFGLLFS